MKNSAFPLPHSHFDMDGYPSLDRQIVCFFDLLSFYKGVVFPEEHKPFIEGQIRHIVACEVAKAKEEFKQMYYPTIQFVERPVQENKR